MLAEYMAKYYLTTPIYYVNDVPHIGHAYTTIVGDVLARWHRLRGEDVRYVTGTDENAQKNAEVAVKNASSIEGASVEDVRTVTQRYVDEMSAKWRLTWDELGISNDDFIRTTEPRHIAGVEKFFAAVNARGDIYKDTYTGYYCIGCEAYKKESDLVNGKCPDHNRVPEERNEENYFFRASTYRDALLQHIADHPEFVQPVSRRNEVVEYVKGHFTDFSISRKATDWGIPFPTDPTHVMYVWFDALLNYMTAVGYGTDDALFKKYWPADLHLVGKDIIKFHCAYWPAMLMSAGLPLPKTVFAHGFFTINGQKMSKSLGNVVDPTVMAKTYGIDALRYYLLREIPFGEDGDFSTDRFAQRYESDLANGLGNLVQRVTTLAVKSRKSKVESTTPLRDATIKIWEDYDRAMAEYRFHDALTAVWALVKTCDEYVETKKPWTLAGDELAATIAPLVECLRHIAWMLWPLMPTTAETILERLGILDASRAQPLADARQWSTAAYTATKGVPMFPRMTSS